MTLLPWRPCESSPNGSDEAAPTFCRRVQQHALKEWFVLVTCNRITFSVSMQNQWLIPRKKINHNHCSTILVLPVQSYTKAEQRIRTYEACTRYRTLCVHLQRTWRKGCSVPRKWMWNHTSLVISNSSRPASHIHKSKEKEKVCFTRGGRLKIR